MQHIVTDSQMDALTGSIHAQGAELAGLRKDAERYRKLQAQATKKTAYDVYGNGCLWSIGIHSEDSRLPFSAVVDALPAVGAA